MPALDPKTNIVTIGTVIVTQFASGSSYDYTNEDGFKPTVGVGGKVVHTRVHDPSVMVNIHLIQGSPEIALLSAQNEAYLAAGSALPPLPISITDVNQPGQVFAGTGYPSKRPDNPGIGTEAAAITFSYTAIQSVNTQGGLLG